MKNLDLDRDQSNKEFENEFFDCSEIQFSKEEKCKEISKYFYPDEEGNLRKYVNHKKRKWTFGFSNDYPMQHGDGVSITLDEDVALKIYELILFKQKHSD